MVSSMKFIGQFMGQFIGRRGMIFLLALASCCLVISGNLWAGSLSLLPPAQAQTSASQLLSLYQPIQNIIWEGQYVSTKGIAYFSNTGQPQISDYASADPIRSAIALHANGEYDRAIPKYLASLEQTRTEALKDQAKEIMLLGNLGLSYASNGQFYEAVDYFNQYFAQTWHKAYYYQGTDPKLGGLALGNIGKVFFASEIYIKALEFQEKRLALSQEIKDPLGEARALGDLGIIYQSLGEYAKAIEYQQQSLTLARTLENPATIALALSNLGIANQTLGDYRKAINFHQQYLDLVRQNQDRLGEIQALGNLGGAYYLSGNLEQAISFYEQGLKVAFDIAEPRMAAIIRGNLGLAYFQRETSRPNNQQNEQGQQQTIDFYRQFINVIPAQAAGLTGLARNNFAVAYNHFNDPAGAERQFMQGMESWEKVRQNLGDNDGYKVSFLETQGAIYNNFQKFLTNQNKPTQALEISERSRARAFVELLSRRLSPNAPRIQKISPIDIAQIKQVAQSQQATLVEYSIIYEDFLTSSQPRPQESELLIWVVKPNGEVHQRRVDLKPLWQSQNTTLAEMVNRTRDALGVGRGSGRSTYGKMLQDLYQLLITPIEDLLPSAQATNQNRLVIIPQRSLFLLPFPALQDAQGKYLIDKYTLQTAPSIQVLQLTQQQNQKVSGQEFLIIGNPTMPLVTLPGQFPQQLEDLPGAEKEAQAIAQLFNTAAITGSQATKAAVMRRMPQAKIIHLATHGLLDDFSGAGVPGALVFAPSNNPINTPTNNPTNNSTNNRTSTPPPNISQQNQELLTSSEILNLRLSSKLVVLSACDTGRGKITGDGVIGLARSFIAAGTASVLVSLWAVPDAPTSELMQVFYQQLQTNPDEAVALQKAMITTKDKYPHPKDWAAFTLIGENK